MWWLTTGCLLFMGGAAVFTFTVDPYQMYHPVLGGRPLFHRMLQRFFVPGLARTADYEVALVGTSMLQNVPNSAVARVCGGPTVNLAMAGASIHEEALTLRLALEHKGTKTVLMTMDYNSFSGGETAPVLGSNFVFPEYLYDDSVFSKLPYLLSLDSLIASYRALYGKVGENETTNADFPWKFPENMKFNAASAVEGIDPSAINSKYHMLNLDLESMKSIFEKNFFEIFSRNPAVKIHIVFSPYSILVWHDYAQRGQIPVYFGFKKWLVDLTKRFPNVDVADYQDHAEIITDLSLYADIYHSSETITERVVAGACSGDSVLTKENFDSRTASLLQLVRSTDPAEIVKAATGKK
jgi:hypothetical protein